jgi:hypothetical protein
MQARRLGLRRRSTLLAGAETSGIPLSAMFPRAKVRKGDGKLRGYFSVVENRRVGVKKRTVRRTVPRPGEINGTQEAAWRKTL